MIQHVHADYFDIFKFVCILENYQVLPTIKTRVIAVVPGLSMRLKSAERRNYESLPTVGVATAYSPG